MEELSYEPAKRAIDTKEHISFVTGVTSLTEEIFKSIDTEGELIATTRKFKRDTQSCFESLHRMANTHVKQV